MKAKQLLPILLPTQFSLPSLALVCSFTYTLKPKNFLPAPSPVSLGHESSIHILLGESFGSIYI